MTKPFMTLCIIPARGGSKRIPRKNIRPFNGKPMIAHSILASRSAGCFLYATITVSFFAHQRSLYDPVYPPRTRRQQTHSA